VITSQLRKKKCRICLLKAIDLKSLPSERRKKKDAQSITVPQETFRLNLFAQGKGKEVKKGPSSQPVKKKKERRKNTS